MALLLGDGDEILRQILGQRHAVGQRVGIAQAALVVVDHLLEQGLAQARFQFSQSPADRCGIDAHVSRSTADLALVRDSQKCLIVVPVRYLHNCRWR